MGYTDMSTNAMATTPKSSYNPTLASTIQNETTFSKSAFGNWIIEPQVNWLKEMFDGNLNLFVGATFLSQESESLAQMVGDSQVNH